jgi:hypothetical protein
MWPRGGKLYAARRAEKAKAKSAWDETAQQEAKFWLAVSDGAIRQWCDELHVELTDTALVE